MNINYVILLFSAILAALGQVFLKLGSMGGSITTILFSSQIWLGLIFYVMGSVLWIYALSKEPLSKVYPFAALTFILIFFFSYFFFNENISLRQLLGLFFIFLGFIVLSLS